MKIFQGPIEMSGQLDHYVKGLSALGHTVEAYASYPCYIPEGSQVVSIDNDKLIDVFNSISNKTDVFHFQYGLSFHLQKEFAFAHEHNRVRLMHFWGNEVRSEREAVRLNPYARFMNHFMEENSIHERVDAIYPIIPACIVPDFEIAAYTARIFERIYVLPLAIDLANWIPNFEVSNTPLIVHDGRDGELKGSEYVDATIERLRQAGINFEYLRLDQESPDEAKGILSRADIVIDQLLCGSYGLASVEAMALGKPVICHIREDVLYRMPGLPITSANPATLFTALHRLINDPNLRNQLGSAGRQFVEAHHSVPVIASHLGWIYSEERRVLDGIKPKVPAVIHLYGDQRIEYGLNTETARISLEAVSNKVAIAENLSKGDKVVLKPNRIFVLNGKKSKKSKGSKERTYLSFNLSEVSTEYRIVNAVFRVGSSNKSQLIPVYSVKKGWNTKQMMSKQPKTATVPYRRMRSSRKHREHFLLRCTALAKKWRNDQISNHGICLVGPHIKNPRLVIKIAAK
ncbi:glycosyltransferase family 4 protein [Paenibacillus sp. SYP-B3998]|uniref:Glycosyltransferase family 4 protein n=1 Tax=Paenibacillus sp. SYP-B3998 TaxID=2678564 RepID=A0A6G3ZQW6_9BACL|nr:glycosyltransferase family 4 protein [Paenibacillus sp. SYP-B3998]NEW04428.1 glycosyltransferase family 4 protein [Paenibacillus sp. SYP-B3998]